jgi:hypothetical protein
MVWYLRTGSILPFALQTKFLKMPVDSAVLLADQLIHSSGFLLVP